MHTTHPRKGTHATPVPSGFTLVELLVVLSILSLLMTTATQSLESAKVRARDTERTAIVTQVAIAVTQYREKHGRYPCMSWSEDTDPDFLQVLLDEGFLSSRPKDPLSPNRTITYMSYTNAVGGPCGQVAHMDVDFERPQTVCPYGVMADNWAHCHVFIPSSGVTACANPYVTNDLGGDACDYLEDNPANNDW